MEKAIITVIGKDKVGIISSICNYLATKDINILDISQTILDGYFNMMMMVDASVITDFEEVSSELSSLGEKIGVDIKIQHVDIFNKMHRI